MKRFIFSILCVSVFFIGVGALVEKSGARFKSDEKALELVRKARVAIGGDNAIAGVQSMIIVGKTMQTIKVNGVESVEQGETEIAMQLPDKLMKMIKMGDATGTAHKIINKQVEVVVAGNAKDKLNVTVDGKEYGEGSGAGVRKIVIKKDDGTVQELSGSEADKTIVRTGDGRTATFTSKDGKTINIDDDHHIMMSRVGGAGRYHDAMRHNEMLRLTLSLLLTAPQGMDVEYTFGGEGDVDGTACNIVVAAFGGQAFKLYLDRSSNLPVMMSYTGHKMPVLVTFNKEFAAPADGSKDTMIFRRSEGPAPERAEFNVKFSDYRLMNGVQLPFKWTQTVGGAADETFDVTSFEINPANIAEKFQNQKVMVRTKKPDTQ